MTVPPLIVWAMKSELLAAVTELMRAPEDTVGPEMPSVKPRPVVPSAISTLLVKPEAVTLMLPPEKPTVAALPSSLFIAAITSLSSSEPASS